MQGVAICAPCAITFPYEPSTSKRERVRCPECDWAALTPETDSANYFSAYHSIFPSHMGKSRRKRISSIAKKILSGELSLQEVAEATPRANMRRFKVALSAVDIATLTALLFMVVIVWNWLQEIRQQQGLAEEPETKERFFASLIDTYVEMRPSRDDEESWPFLPKPPPVPITIAPSASSPTSRSRSRVQSQSETSAAPKRGQRKPASPSKKKKP